MPVLSPDITWSSVELLSFSTPEQILLIIESKLENDNLQNAFEYNVCRMVVILFRPQRANTFHTFHIYRKSSQVSLQQDKFYKRYSAVPL